MNIQQKDDLLWQTAKKRSAFKQSFASWFFVNLLLVCVWYFTSNHNSYFWPVWPILGWGIGILFQYFQAYHNHSIFSAEAEYEKLKNNINNN